MNVLRSSARRFARPLREYLDWRFDRIESLVQNGTSKPLQRVDVSRHNARGVAPTFDRLVSQVVSSAHFADETFVRWRRRLDVADVPRLHRKIWEYCYILAAAEQNGVLVAGNRAVGFGVGREPIPAVLAREGLQVVATDLDPAAERTADWATTGQHMSGTSALAHPSILDVGELERLVETRFVDMNAIPSDLGGAHLVWSCGSLEHLGSPEAGLDFVLRTLSLLEPGGVAVHTTELELVPQPAARDHGHLAVYRPEDLDGLVARIREGGFEIESNWTVSLDTPTDRLISTPPHPRDEPVHLKLVVGDSVLTSVGVIARRPLGQADAD
jgi:hypothetical protein